MEPHDTSTIISGFTRDFKNMKVQENFDFIARQVFDDPSYQHSALSASKKAGQQSHDRQPLCQLHVTCKFYATTTLLVVL
jgi:hypothetical protein